MRLCETIDAKILGKFVGDDPRALGHLSASSGKRRRIGLEYKKYVATEAIKNKVAHNAGQLLRVSDNTVAPQSGRQWEEDETKAQLVANRRVLTLKGISCVMEDASRSGKPSENTTHFICVDLDADVAAYLPPMVTMPKCP